MPSVLALLVGLIKLEESALTAPALKVSENFLGFSHF